MLGGTVAIQLVAADATNSFLVCLQLFSKEEDSLCHILNENRFYHLGDTRLGAIVVHKSEAEERHITQRTVRPHPNIIDQGLSHAFHTAEPTGRLRCGM